MSRESSSPLDVEAHGGSGDERLLGGSSNDGTEFYGDASDDQLRLGSAPSGLLAGGAGDDELLGGPGYDRLLGGGGADKLYGSAAMTFCLTATWTAPRREPAAPEPIGSTEVPEPTRSATGSGLLE